MLLQAGHELLVLDDFSNSSPVALERAQELGGGSIECVRGDVRDPELINGVFGGASIQTPINAVIHFAGLKAVSESAADPMRHWDVNFCVAGLCCCVNAHACRTLVFSSTRTFIENPRNFHLEHCQRRYIPMPRANGR